MDREAYKLFATLERTHWWFVGRRGLYLPLVASVLEGDRGMQAAPHGLDVLDVGCGTGGFLTPLQTFGRVTGVEIDEPSLEWCARHGGRRLLRAHSDRLPLADASVDLVCLFDVIEHASDDAAVLAEAARVVRPGGHVAVSVPAYQWLYANNDRVAHHFRRYTRGGLVGRLQDAGLAVRRATYVNVLLGLAIIPTVAAIKVKQQLFGVREAAANNLAVPVPRPLNALLGRVFASERHLLRHVSAPFGHSLLAVARRPPTPDGEPHA